MAAGVDDLDRIVISTYPDRAKAVNARRDPAVSVLVHSDEWDGPYVQVDGTAEVLDMPAADAEDALVEYFPWGPIATGGFPPDRAPTD